MRAVVYQGARDISVEQVVEVGPAVHTVKVGDRVCPPFNVSCGFCKNCERGLTGFCLTVNPPSAGGAYGYADMGRSHNLGLPDAPDAYRHFDNRDAGWAKVVLNPGKG